MDDDLRQAVLEASERLWVCQEVSRVYEDVEAEVSRQRPACAMSGACCRFEDVGHRLYVTTMEAAAFVHDLRRMRQMAHRLRQSIRGWQGEGCPFQVEKLCGVHAIRPFGCRMFFCDASSVEWQHVQYERFHGELKRLHEALGVVYQYMEWREALRGVILPAVQDV